jgi:Mg2+-importing ATPase
MTETAVDRIGQHAVSFSNHTTWRDLADAPVFTVFRRMHSAPRGLTERDAADRLRQCGDNEPPRLADERFAARVGDAVRSPFVILLVGLGAVFAAVGDGRGASMVSVIVVAAVALRIWQRTRSVRATRSLRHLVISTVTVRRRADSDDEPLEREVPPQDLVPGDVVVLRSGDVIPADLRIVSSSDLVVDQSCLSGESLPAAKAAKAFAPRPDARRPVADTPGMCFSGTSVVSGSAVAVVIATGAHTYAGALARAGDMLRPVSSFDRGVRSVGFTLVRFMFVLAPIVFAVNGMVRGVWAEAAMFAVAVAVGLTPEMLPVVVTTNLARGATRLARDRVVVRRLDAIQDLGGVDVLCVDKTGTLTEDRFVYAQSMNVTGLVDEFVAELAYLAVHFQDDGHDPLDQAITELLAHPDMPILADATYRKVDEIPFDHSRRRSTVVVASHPGEHVLICKGDPDRVLQRCTQVRVGDDIGDDPVAFDDGRRAEARELIGAYREHGMRMLAVAVRTGQARIDGYGEPDERNLVLAGFVGFVDPVRDGAAAAVRTLADHGVAVKILTGDSAAVARRVAVQVGIDADSTVTGGEIGRLTDPQLSQAVARSSVLAELSPADKARIVAALRAAGHAVGFVGDGVNDVSALRLADAGIAADTAAEAAKHAADMVLLDKDLAVLAAGVVEGRRTLANTLKYVKITASSNFGNVLSVLAASVLLPFLPMLPIQLMVQNLLYDCAQLALAWDRVDDGYLRAPRRWVSSGLIRFMLVFGTLSSVFDLATFAVLWWVYHAAPAVFHTGWFVEGLLTQLLVVLVLRSPKLPWRGARPGPGVVAAAAGAAALGLLLPLTPLAGPLRLAALPASYALWLIAVVSTYGFAAHLVKKCYLRFVGSWM